MFLLGEFHELFDPRSQDGKSVLASEMRDSARSGRGGVGQDREARCAKKIGQSFFRDIAHESNARIFFHAIGNALHVPSRLGVITSGNHQFGHGKFARNSQECVYQGFEPLVGAPLSKRQHTMDWIPAMVEVRGFGATGEDSMMANAYRAASVFFAQRLVVSGQQYGYRIRRKQKMSRNAAGSTVKLLGLDPCVGQIDSFKQLVESDVGVA